MQDKSCPSRAACLDHHHDGLYCICARAGSDQAAAIHMIAGMLTVKGGSHTGSYSGQIKTDKNRKEKTTPFGVILMRC